MPALIRLNELTVDWGLHFISYNSRDHFEEEIRRVGWNNYCFGFELSEIVTGVKEVNITYMFPQDTDNGKDWSFPAEVLREKRADRLLSGTAFQELLKPGKLQCINR